MKHLTVTGSLTFCLFASIAMPFAPGASAQTLPAQNPSSGGQILHLDGLDMEFDATGNWKSVYSTYTQPVTIPDRQGIKKAQIIAEEKGKAQIVRFLDQQVQSDRLVEEVDSAVQNTHRSQTATQDGSTKSSDRTLVESTREFTRSYASESLRGVTILDVGYNDKAEEVWVKVGMSRTMLNVADAMRRAMNSTNGQSGDQSHTDGITGRQPSESRGTRPFPQ